MITTPQATQSASGDNVTSRTGQPSPSSVRTAARDRVAGRGVGLVVALVEMTHEAEAQAVRITLERGAIVGDRVVGAGRVGRVVTGHRLQRDRAILGGPGE